MPADTIFVSSVVAVAAALLASNRVLLDVVALLVVTPLLVPFFP